MNNNLKLELSTWTLVKFILVILGFYLAYLIRDIIVILFIVAILVAALRPVVNKWEKKIGRGLAVISVFLIMVAIITIFIYLVVPPLVDQTKQFINNIPETANRFTALRNHFPSLSTWGDNITKNLGNYTGSFISITEGVLGGIANFITVIILTLYFLLDQQIFSRFLQSIIPTGKKVEIIKLTEKISTKIGDWLRGQLLLGLIMGILTFIGLSIIRVPYALTLAVVACVMEILPIIGPIISGALSGIVALSVSPLAVLFVILLTIVLHQLEGNLIAPKILQKAIGLPAAIILLAILIGAKLLGLAGALLAVPLAGIIYVLAQEWQNLNPKNDDRED